MLRLWALHLGLLFIVACGGSQRQDQDPQEASTQARTVLVISVDGLGAEAYDPKRLPAMESLASEALRFPHHVVASTALNPELASLFTGLYPTRHGLTSIQEPGRGRLAESARTLAEAASEAGWATLGGASLPQLGRSLAGFDQGFDSYSAPPVLAKVLSAQQVLDAVRADVEEALDGDQPVFLWLCLSDPARMDEGAREAAVVPLLKEFLAPFREARPRLATALDNLSVEGGYPDLIHILGRRRGSAEYRAWREALHVAGLQRVDRVLAELRKMVKASGRARDALWVIEGSRGAVIEPPTARGGPIFRPEIVRTPMIIRLPGGAGAGDSELLCSTVDLAPTLAGAMNLELGAGDGRNLLSVRDESQGPLPGLVRATKPVYCEGPLLVQRAAFGPKLHVEEVQDRGSVGFDQEGRALLRETELENEAQNRLRNLRDALMLYAVHWGFALERGAGEGPDLGLRWRLLDGHPRDVRLERGTAGGHVRPTGLGGEALMPTGSALVVETSHRDVALSLELTLPRKFRGHLQESHILLGDKPLSESWIPRLPSGHRTSWPRDLDDGAVPFDLDLVRDSSLHTRFVSSGEPGREVELLIALYPPARPNVPVGDHSSLEWAGSGLEVMPFLGRDDVVRLRAVTPLDLQVQEPPGKDLAICMRVDGETVPLNRIRRDGQYFAAPGTLAVYVPQWLPGEDMDISGERSADLPSGWIRLLRTGPKSGAPSAFGDDERKMLSRLRSGE